MHLLWQKSRLHFLDQSHVTLIVSIYGRAYISCHENKLVLIAQNVLTPNFFSLQFIGELSDTAPSSVARLPENVIKNRFMNILPCTIQVILYIKLDCTRPSLLSRSIINVLI